MLPYQSAYLFWGLSALLLIANVDINRNHKLTVFKIVDRVQLTTHYDGKYGSKLGHEDYYVIEYFVDGKTYRGEIRCSSATHVNNQIFYYKRWPKISWVNREKVNLWFPILVCVLTGFFIFVLKYEKRTVGRM